MPAVYPQRDFIRVSRRGLTSQEAAARLTAEGPNELPQTGHRRLLRIVREVLSEPMFALLVAAGVIYLLLGDTVEAILLLAFASLSVGIAVAQETRSERVLEALRDLTSPRALVIRDGERLRIPGREVVRGDLIVLSEGDRVPADASLLEARELQIDESLLTGEAAPVRKIACEAESWPAPRPGGDDLPYIFSGTLVVRGQGLAQVFATGMHSEIGRIGQTLKSIEAAPPRLTLQTARIVRVAAGFGLLCGLAVILLYGFLRGSWLKGLLAGIALGMSLLPEEFPLVLTVFMVMGAWRISRARVLTRRAAAIETLGEATVLCTDKTGTLTENRMSVVALRASGETLAEPLNKPMPALTPAFRRLAIVGALASATDAYDPMDRAFHELGNRIAAETDPGALVRVYGLQPDLLAVTQVWQSSAGGKYRVAAKGAPEAIAELCRLEPAARVALAQIVQQMAETGMRVLAVAEGKAEASAPLPATPREFAFDLLGVAGLADPLRPSAPAAIRECRSAGIRVAMITGDHPLTARAIAHQAGIGSGEVLDGPTIERMTDVELEAAVQHTSIFARIPPIQKLRIVTALKAHGDVVAMTGDGVNDAPSLKAADIGIAMGGRGSDVAREAASLVLLDDDFGSIVHTIRLGRRIYDNLRKAMAFIIAVHIPIAGLSLIPLLAGLPLIFAPVHIAFLEMVIDPVCSMVFEAESAEPDIMSRPPRAATSTLFSPALIGWSLLQGAVVLILLIAVYLAAPRWGLPEADARTLVFVSLILVDLGLVLVNRSFGAALGREAGRTNQVLWWVSGITVALLASVVVIPVVRSLFQFGPLHIDDLAVIAATVITTLIVLESLKRFWRKYLIA